MEISVILFVLAGVLAGILGGMGMGGGTILIPILTIFFSVSQHVSQSINLIAFVPMAIVALTVHAKNKLIKTKGLLFIILPASAVSLLASLLSNSLDGELLKKFFGAFLVCLSVVELFLPKLLRRIKNK
ncbi:MAG: TSUP family transporter [Clostridia bacterium]|nr:TSUP family transporter [Clostridia bacterium]